MTCLIIPISWCTYRPQQWQTYFQYLSHYNQRQLNASHDTDAACEGLMVRLYTMLDVICHIQHFEWINLSFSCDDISLYISLYPPFGICFILSSSPNPSLLSHTPYFPSFLHSSSPTHGKLNPAMLDISDGTNGGVTCTVLPVCLQCPSMSSYTGYCWANVVRAIELSPTSPPSVGSYCRGGYSHLNMNEVYSWGVFTSRRWVLTHNQADGVKR